MAGTFRLIVRASYRIVQRLVISRLPANWQEEVQRYAFRLHCLLFPGRVRASAGPTSDQTPLPLNPPALPEWVIEEMRAIGREIDPSLYPFPGYAKSFAFDVKPYGYVLPGRLYARIRRQVPFRPDLVLMTAWLKAGGADLGVLHIANGLAGQGRKVVVMTTEPLESPWAARLRPEVGFVELGTLLQPLSLAERLAVLARVLVQIKPKALHVMNSKLCWETIARYSRAIRQETRIFASLYCDDFDDAVPVGYARKYLPGCYDKVDEVVSDNAHYPKVWARDMGVPASLFTTLRFPVQGLETATYRAEPVKRLLWAGRLDRQKRPDILARIAARLPDYEFVVYGRPVLAAGGKVPDTPQALLEQRNIRLMGAYERFADLLAAGPYCAFLYTSEWDGLPNVLLEAAASGLPLIAPDVGGIAELVDPSTGFLIQDFEDADAYAEAVRSAAAPGGDARGKWDRCLLRLREEHSEARFAEAIAGLYPQ